MENGADSTKVQVKLVFANDDNTKELTLPLSLSIKDLKQDILENHWPPTLPSDVARLRLFAGGKEIGGKDGADNQRLNEAKILSDLSKIGVPAVHVQAVPKAMAVAVESKKKQGSACACSLM
ncbi:unnamed protein product [Cladocopium goreaui]|uniref:UBL3-like ubiquitin domain-containing protein n=1 Tax=Cladocopium goreaui TaxID=2562237 RepID=A0A9P1D049_9DINO|nr:unnamed protein product [Cladocopium goreaui]